MSSLTIEEAFRTSLGGEPYRHQREAAKAILEGNSVLIRAPCGSGKTEACVLPFLIGRREKLPSRLIYSLPTRALADDVIERITDKANKIGSDTRIAVQHGANSKDPFFKVDLIVATIDQTVGAYCATPLSLPAYLGNIPAGAATSSMLCFDEVHTYDYLLGLQAMRILVRRAQCLRLPCVIMSATLPDTFVEYFADKGFVSVDGRDEDVPKRRDRKVVLHWVGKCLEAADVLEKAVAGKRIIVVCNTVDKAQRICREVEGKLSPVFLLHSRFLPKDRQHIEEEMKTHFRNKKPGCLITTQVCEVGLDVSCDIMLTEIAPPDSLIQRLGRCAREGHEGDAYVFDVENSAPYEREIVEKCKTYVIENWNGEIVGWNKELEVVNSLLSESFERIMKNEDRQWWILDSLAEAAFRGDKTRVEQNVREILNVNLTIHDDPSSLGNNILRMPWLSLDVRLLQREFRRGIRLWSLKWNDDEGGHPSPKISWAENVEPYGYYVVHPDFARYDAVYGLIFGESGRSLTTIPPEEFFNTIHREYHMETWFEHAMKCLDAFEKICIEESSTIELLARLLDSEHKATCGTVSYAVGLHDIGKLNRDWQKAVGARDVPLAHVPFLSGKPPPHATISGYALQGAFQGIRRLAMRSILALAIGHHHHTRAETVDAYRFITDWEKPVAEVCDRIADAYGIGLSLDEIRSFSGPSCLDVKFPGFESIRTYTAYTIVSRLIRLSDQGSFTVSS